MGWRRERARRPLHRDFAAHRLAHPPLLRPRFDRHPSAGRDRPDRRRTRSRVDLRDGFAARSLQADRSDRRGVPAPPRPRAGGDRRRPGACEDRGDRRPEHTAARPPARSRTRPVAREGTGVRLRGRGGFRHRPTGSAGVGNAGHRAGARRRARDHSRARNARADRRAVRGADLRCHRRCDSGVRGEPEANRFGGLRGERPSLRTTAIPA